MKPVVQRGIRRGSGVSEEAMLKEMAVHLDSSALGDGVCPVSEEQTGGRGVFSKGCQRLLCNITFTVTCLTKPDQVHWWFWSSISFGLKSWSENTKVVGYVYIWRKTTVTLWLSENAFVHQMSNFYLYRCVFSTCRPHYKSSHNFLWQQCILIYPKENTASASSIIFDVAQKLQFHLMHQTSYWVILTMSPLNRHLQTFNQNVSCPTRWDKTLKLCYGSVKMLINHFHYPHWALRIITMCIYCPYIKRF